MEALRFVVCGRPECRQVFFLCSACDRGRRYCGPGCRRRARRESLREAGQRYQRTRDGRHAHAARQAAYRARRREKVTHQPPALVAEEARVCPAPAVPATEAGPSGPERPLPHAARPTCALCGRTSPFTRHQTLARFRARWRRRPP